MSYTIISLRYLIINNKKGRKNTTLQHKSIYNPFNKNQGMTTRTLPDYMFVEQEGDIANLIEGDRIKVSVMHGKEPKWMAYGGHTPLEFGQLSSTTDCSFIEIPQKYTGEDVPVVHIWKSYLQHLQFSQTHIEFNSLYLRLDVVKQGTEEYSKIKSLIDKLN